MTRPRLSKAGPVARVSISLPPEMMARVNAYCKNRGCSKSWFVRKLVMADLKKAEREARP